MDFSLPYQHKRVDVFWGELAPCDHCVQIYDDDNTFLASLEAFVASGFEQDEAVVLIGTPAHLAGLEPRLGAKGVDVPAARERGQYIALDAEETLAKFMVSGWPVEALFEETVGNVLGRARREHKKVRAFGEMVALMWERGQSGAVVRLEQLWTGLCHRESFALFCAYPRVGFSVRDAATIAQVFAAHSKVCAV